MNQKKPFIDYCREWFHYGRYKLMKEFIMSENLTQPKLLDLGCSAPCSSMMNDAFLEYMGFGSGIDIEPRNSKFPFKIGDVKNIPHPDNSFDIIVAAEVLEHITEPEKALKEIKRILKPKGIFIFSTPNNNLFWRISWFFWELSFGGMWKHTHLIKYKEKQWIKMLKKYFNIKRKISYLSIILIVKLQNRKS